MLKNVKRKPKLSTLSKMQEIKKVALLPNILGQIQKKLQMIHKRAFLVGLINGVTMQNTAKELFNKIKSTKEMLDASKMIRDPEERKKLIQEGVKFFTGKMLSSAKNSLVNYFKK